MKWFKEEFLKGFDIGREEIIKSEQYEIFKRYLTFGDIPNINRGEVAYLDDYEIEIHPYGRGESWHSLYINYREEMDGGKKRKYRIDFECYDSYSREWLDADFMCDDDEGYTLKDAKCLAYQLKNTSVCRTRNITISPM